MEGGLWEGMEAPIKSLDKWSSITCASILSLLCSCKRLALSTQRKGTTSNQRMRMVFMYITRICLPCKQTKLPTN